MAYYRSQGNSVEELFSGSSSFHCQLEDTHSPPASSHHEDGTSNMGDTERTPKRLVLCFDGTGNSFTGKDNDTNVVKIYKMCNRSSKDQYHYYQPGIGTYIVNSHDSVNQGFWGTIASWWSRLMDQGFGTSLDSHVIAGYRFLMRYYNVGDEIYMFGFSRGAFTARFLAALINGIGIMSKGNEELVPFAYKIYQDYELGIGTKASKQQKTIMKDFKDTFCLGNTTVHFLGLFDTVRSVGTFDTGSRTIPVSQPFATFVRHAVALDERRGKFKAALLCQNDNGKHTVHTAPENPMALDIHIRERWFPGNHGDVGGGWDIEKKNALGKKNHLLHSKDAKGMPNPLQLSDIALGWMLREIQELPEAECKAGSLDLDRTKVAAFAKQLKKEKHEVVKSKQHDVLSFGKGAFWLKVIFWRLLEYSPFNSRLELQKETGLWVRERWSLNRGGTRDLPLCAVLDSSVFDRHHQLKSDYKPKNLNFEIVKKGSRWD